MIISTEKIFKAISYYQQLGYQMIDVPMVVDETSSNLTKPTRCNDLYHDDKVYVASAEQSFIQLYDEGKLSEGKYMALTPCYRDEASIDETHFNIFLKLELIEIPPLYKKTSCVNVIADAVEFFKSLNLNVTEIYNSEPGIHDINLGSIEIGSYGIRSFSDGRKYIFGTGIAEPRLSYAITQL